MGKGLYICDPDKCINCEKTCCQDLCFRTTSRTERATGLTWLKHFVAWIKAGRN